MEDKKIKAIIENILLVSENPLTLEKITKVFAGEHEKKVLKKLLEELIADYQKRSYQILKIAGGYQLTTRFEYASWIKKFYKLERRTKLSRAALETLAIVAYKQPLTRAEIEDIRGVDISGILRSLLEKGLIKIVGKKQVLGRPALYGTSRKFLEYFGMKNLTELPNLKEFNLEEINPADKVEEELDLLEEVKEQADKTISGGVESVNVTVTENNLRGRPGLETPG